MKVSIQPGYLAWLGFFEQLAHGDVFVHCDTVQYTRHDWRNRNRIKTKNGVQWLTVPVSGSLSKRINEIVIRNDEPWIRKHVGALYANYKRTPFFDMYFMQLREILSKKWTYLADLDLELIGWLIVKLSIHVKTLRASQLRLKSENKQYLGIEICKAVGCKHFYEGQSGRNYIDTELFKANGITVEFQDYEHPYYNQLWVDEQGFVSHLSVIDLLFNHGPESLAILTGKKVIAPPKNVKVRSANEL